MPIKKRIMFFITRTTIGIIKNIPLFGKITFVKNTKVGLDAKNNNCNHIFTFTTSIT
jgi:hypothetical protein